MTVRRLPALLCLAFCLGVAAGPTAAQSPAASLPHVQPRSPDCAAPPEMTQFKARLPNTARAIRRGEKLTIVALGSSSTEGVGATGPERSYPAQLAAALRHRWPELDILVINKGIGGEDAPQMVKRFETDVLPYAPQLVIWQVGSNYALGTRDVGAYAVVLSKGVSRLKSANIDIVLMDLQYAPMVLSKPAHQRILDTMETVSGDLKVAMFHRFDIMKHWVSSGKYKMEDVISRDRLHMNDRSYGCIGRLLADSLSTAALAVQPVPAGTNTQQLEAAAAR